MATITVLPTLDLEITDSFNNMNSLTIADYSQYSTIPSSSDVALQITPASYATVNVTFSPGSVNVYKCVDLGITCSTPDCCALPDGIYELKYSVAANGNDPATSIDKTFIRVDNIRCKWMNAFLKVDLECDCKNDEQQKYKEELKRISLLIDGAIAAANNCDGSLSFKLYNKADSLLNTLCCKFNMPCSTIQCNSCGCH